jgi:GNAT superfamily N-acetyltransferase
MKITIRKARPGDERPWRRLWGEYLRLNGQKPHAALTRQNWARIMNEASALNALVAARKGSGVIGIAHYVIHESPWTLGPVCYLSDLIVDSSLRGRGIGRLFMDWLIREARRQGWSRLYWHAKENNYRARALYDKYTEHDECLRYCLNFKSRRNQ